MRQIFAFLNRLSVFVAILLLLYWGWTQRKGALIMVFYLLVSAAVFGLFELITIYIPTRWAFLAGFVAALLFVILFMTILHGFE